jgi:hypothetical protein
VDFPWFCWLLRSLSGVESTETLLRRTFDDGSWKQVLEGKVVTHKRMYDRNRCLRSHCISHICEEAIDWLINARALLSSDTA